MKSIGQKIMQVEGLLGTSDVSDWEEEFLERMIEISDHGKKTAGLSEKQVSIIDRIWGRHFA